MSAEEQAPGRQPMLAEFEEVFADFLNGAVSLAQLRRCLLEVIDKHPDALPAVQEKVDAAMHAGRLPEPTWENLTAEIDHLVSENTPTEWSEETVGSAKPVEPPLLTEPVSGESREHPPAEGVAQTETTRPMPESADLPPGTVLEDRFVLVSRAEQGSMGTVYKALDRRRKEAGAEAPWVAIKLITTASGRPAAAADMLRNEADIGCRLQHANIARTHALHEDGAQLFISMEWLDGESLDRLLDRKRPHALPREQAMKIIANLADALEHAHAQGVVHADIKPGNVFLTQSGEVKLLDFGIARAGKDAAPGASLRARTPAYASCEVLEGSVPDMQDDLFSLAALAYRVLTGRRAFGSANALEAERETREPVPVPGLSPQQWRALSHALAWRREQRSRDVATFIAGFFEQGRDEAAVATTAARDRGNSLAETSVESERSVDTEATGPRAAEPDAGEVRQGASWMRPALAAGVIGAAVTAGWLMLGDKPVPDSRPPANAALQATSMPDEAEPVTTAGRAADSPARPAPQARISDGAEGEELLLFLPGSGIPFASDINADSMTSAGAQPAAKAADTPLPPDEEAVAAPTEPRREIVAAEPEPADENLVPEPAGEMPEDQPAGPSGQAVAATAENRPPVEAADTATPVTAAETVAATSGPGREVAAAEPEPAEQARAAEPEVAEQDTVSAPAEAVLASTMSLAMVTPESAPRPAQPERDTVPEPEPVAMPEPDEYGPPPELAPPQVEQVLLSTLKFKRFVEPEFPPRAREDGVSGWVDLRFLVNDQGETADIEVLDAQPAGTFEEAAVNAVERWRFKPRRVDGEAVDSRTQIRLRFE